ncbi:MAG TPA: FAD binding domain-containing protein [Roseiflexaceae bacterium]|nr:FAD binding domain-containing protein [Roseiflexaceae bacterium]HMP40329.1 FAD binding domain-containing protein [Roseiflexaceae bacterium]
MWQHYYRPTQLAEALALLRQHAGRARLIAGGTDAVVELQRSGRPVEVAIDLSGIGGMHAIERDGDWIEIGMLATHHDVISAPVCTLGAMPLVQACREIGAPQIRNRATVVGNLVTASPANDTITALVALDAQVVVQHADAQRVVPLAEFHPGFRRTLLQPDELVRAVRLPLLQPNQRGLFLKLGLRRAQAIAVVNVAVVVTFAGEATTTPVQAVRLALGCVAPTIIRVPQAEAALVGLPLTPEQCVRAGALAAAAITPIDDVRGSAAYRRATIESLVMHALSGIAADAIAAPPPAPLLATATVESAPLPYDGVIHTTINGTAHTLVDVQQLTLLDAVRHAGYTGSKIGCAEGECGACTLWLDGRAVMGCLVPAGQAHGAQVTTIEGLAQHGALHPLQQAFIDHAAVQCGYCIPGFLMAGAKLLAEVGQPDRTMAQEALGGNICRCTGYRKILDAVVAAGEQGGA